MHSPDLPRASIDKLAKLFPNCVTESRDEQGRVKQVIDFDLLRQELSGQIVEGPQERYHLEWPGKREALLAANAPIAKTLRPCREPSVDFDNTRNLFISVDDNELENLCAKFPHLRPALNRSAPLGCCRDSPLPKRAGCAGTGSRPAAASSLADGRQPVLPVRGEGQAGGDIGFLQLGEVFEYLLVAEPGGELFQHVIDRYPQSPDAGPAAALARFDGDSLLVAQWVSLQMPRGGLAYPESNPPRVC